MKLRVIIALSSAALLTLALALVSSAGPTGCVSDVDGDGICDSPGDDNCSTVANPGQRDDDEDGYGNICDTDTNQDCGTGGLDVSGVFGRLTTGSPWTPKNAGAYDINEDNGVGALDVSSVFGKLTQNPGPTSRACADCTALPTSGLGLGICP